MNTGVIFTGAAWHSGSTVLGLMLGAHPSIFYGGEVMCAARIDDPSAPIHQRMCRLCGTKCPVWGSLRATTEEDLFESLSQRTGRPLVFDSSKGITWIRSQVTSLREIVPLRLVVLTRDGRAVLNSHLRKRPDVPASDHAESWVRKMAKIEHLAAIWPGPVHRVRYEELSRRPEVTLRALSDYLGVGFDPMMLDPWRGDPHPLDSNPGPLSILLRERGQKPIPGLLDPDAKTRERYGSHPATIVPDMRWKDELKAEDLAAFKDVAGEVNRAYSWE